MLKHQINRYLIGKYWGGWDEKHWEGIEQEGRAGTGLCEFGAMSCEMLARELIEEFDLCQCEVNEDNENGAIVTA